jgi:hypothetical protein
VPLRVGDGSQVLRWAANAACARLAFITGARRARSRCKKRRSPSASANARLLPRLGDDASCFVPQRVCTAASDTPLDADGVRGSPQRALKHISEAPC